MKYAQILKKDGKISEDICLLFDEMYLKELIASDKNEELNEGLVCFMILGLKWSITCDKVISRSNN